MDSDGLHKPQALSDFTNIRPIWVFTGATLNKIGFLIIWLIFGYGCVPRYLKTINQNSRERLSRVDVLVHKPNSFIQVILRFSVLLNFFIEGRGVGMGGYCPSRLFHLLPAQAIQSGCQANHSIQGKSSSSKKKTTKLLLASHAVTARPER